MGSSDKKFGKYLLLRRIASGGMAEIYLARQEGISGFAREVVIKRIHEHLNNKADFIDMFLDEARLVAKLSHPNIVSVHEFGKEDNAHYLVMEFVDGEALSAAIKRTGGVEPSHGLRIISEICAGLHYAHSLKADSGEILGIVHRDVSPQNVLLGFDGGVKLIDFGVAKASTQEHETKVGSFKGKYSYMSPEQARGQAADLRSDVHSVGIVLWEMLSGRSLFHRESVFHSMEAVLSMAPPSLAKKVPSLSPRVDEIVGKALAKDVDARYQSCAEMQLDLDELVSEKGMHSSSLALGRYVRDIFQKTSVPPPAAAPVEEHEEYENLDDSGEPVEIADDESSHSSLFPSDPSASPEAPDDSKRDFLDRARTEPVAALLDQATTEPAAHPAEPGRDSGDALRAAPTAPLGHASPARVDSGHAIVLPDVTPSGGVALPPDQPSPVPPAVDSGSVELPPLEPEESKSSVLPILMVGLFLFCVAGVAFFLLVTPEDDLSSGAAGGDATALGPSAPAEPDAGRPARDRTPEKSSDAGGVPSGGQQPDHGDSGPAEEAGLSGDGLPMAFLSVFSTPGGAVVLLDGRSTGERTVVRDLPIDPGEHLVELSLDGYRRWRKNVNAELGETARVSAKLVAIPGGGGQASSEGDAGAAPAKSPPDAGGPVDYGMLSVSTSPPARVFHRGRELGRTPINYVELAAGTYPLTFVTDDGQRFGRTVRISAGRTTRRDFELLPAADEGGSGGGAAEGGDTTGTQ